MTAQRDWKWLLMTDVDAVQSYLFASARLREASGASELLVSFDDKLRRLAKSLDGCAPHAAGGSALIVFPEKKIEQARDFGRQAEGLLARTAQGAHLSTSEVVDIAAHSNFHQAVTQAAQSLERNKRLGHFVEEALTFPLAYRCQSCGAEPVVGRRCVGKGEQKENVVRALGPSCLAKHDARSPQWLSDIWSNLQQKGWSALDPRDRLANDFNALAGNDRLALVVADANGVGLRLRELTTYQEYEDFSVGLKKAIDSSLTSALLAITPSDPTKKQTLPYQVLFSGGDDIVVACCQRSALRFARRLTEEFARLNQNVSWNHRQPLGLSAGVVCCNPGFPFLAAHDIAERLLGEAKRASRTEGWAEGAVDWSVVTESYGSAGRILGDRVISTNNGDVSLRLTGKPYRVGDQDPRSLGAFESACRRLRDQGFPRNKLYNLRLWCSAVELLDVEPENVTAKIVREAHELLQGHLTSFSDRLYRDETAKDTWRNCAKSLGMDTESFMIEQKKGKRWFTAVGDLADGLTLWGEMK